MLGIGRRFVEVHRSCYLLLYLRLFLLTYHTTRIILMINMIMPMVNGIHIGAVTHHHDHEMAEANLRIRNTRKRATTNAMPDAVELNFIM